MQMRDQLGTLYDEAAFGALYPQRGQPVETLWRLAVVTVMQCADDLTDRQAAGAVLLGPQGSPAMGAHMKPRMRTAPLGLRLVLSSSQLRITATMSTVAPPLALQTARGRDLEQRCEKRLQKTDRTVRMAVTPSSGCLTLVACRYDPPNARVRSAPRRMPAWVRRCVIVGRCRSMYAASTLTCFFPSSAVSSLCS
jgi:hypothetical protein